MTRGALLEVRSEIGRGRDVNARNAGGFTPLHHASLYGQHKVCDALLIAGAKVHAPDSAESQPPAPAGLSGHRDSCGLLLAAGAVVSATNERGPQISSLQLQLATAMCGVDLLTAGANANSESLSAETPLQFAAQGSRLNVCSILLAGGLM